MTTFTAIDFETAQGYRWSICQVGLVRVENGVITKELTLLVQPPDNYYWGKFTQIHGISGADTAHAPTFEQVWPSLAPFIENELVVAHNGFGFDFPVLSETLKSLIMDENLESRKINILGVSENSECPKNKSNFGSCYCPCEFLLSIYLSIIYLI